MKVKELLEMLSDMDLNADVTISVYEGCHGPGDSYEISGTDSWAADEKWKTPATAVIQVDKGCMCCQGTQTSKIKLGPQNVSQYWLGLEHAFKIVEESWNWYQQKLFEIGRPADYEASQTAGKYMQAKTALDNVMKRLGKRQANGEPDDKYKGPL